MRVNLLYCRSMTTLRRFFAVALLVLFAAISLHGQETVTPQTDPPRVQVQILTDTKGADLNVYIRTVLIDLKRHWSVVAARDDKADSEAQKAAIIISIAPDGRLSTMRLEQPTQDASFTKAAWGAVQAVHFPVLPPRLTDSTLTMRLLFSAK